MSIDMPLRDQESRDNLTRCAFNMHLAAGRIILVQPYFYTSIMSAIAGAFFMVGACDLGMLDFTIANIPSVEAHTLCTKRGRVLIMTGLVYRTVVQLSDTKPFVILFLPDDTYTRHACKNESDN